MPSPPALTRLIYRSRSRLDPKDPAQAEMLAAIVAKSRVQNRHRQITGVLLFDGDTFLQSLEGPPEAVELLYETIACDQRHERLELIEAMAVERRDFAEWSMAYLDASMTARDALRRFIAAPPEQLCSRLPSAIRAELDRFRVRAPG